MKQCFWKESNAYVSEWKQYLDVGHFMAQPHRNSYLFTGGVEACINSAHMNDIDCLCKGILVI